jgi:hypothetical protein
MTAAKVTPTMTSRAAKTPPEPTRRAEPKRTPTVRCSPAETTGKERMVLVRVLTIATS